VTRDLATGESPFDRAILHGALDLLVSYSWGATVDLHPLEMSGEDADPSSFLRELKFRHLLAVVSQLPGLVRAIEDRPSTKSVLERSESRGAINGRLDIPRYIARRSQVLAYPRRYPVVRQRTNFDTVENQLVRSCLDEISSALRDNPFRMNRAEDSYARSRLSEVRGHLQSRPWSEVTMAAGSDRLRSEAETRIRRRQSGNEEAYQAFLDWRKLWKLDPSSSGQMSSGLKDEIVDGILAFPAGQSFWDKVFEVWCLRLVRDALIQLAWKELEQPRPLYTRSGVVLRHMTPGGQVASVCFQRQKGLSGSWRYDDAYSVRRLVGIPDIMVTLEKSDVLPLFVDAKYRLVELAEGGGFTRPDETYKMLGYAENFSRVEHRFFGVLIFPASGNDRRTLVRQGRGHLELLTANPASDATGVVTHIAEVLNRWLEAVGSD